LIKPLFLLADSQLLFWKSEGSLFTERIRGQLDSADPTAAYIGASNGDDPQFYSIFEAAVGGIALSSCRMIPSQPTAEDREFLGRADLILLAGGDVERGWKVFEENGLKELVTQRRFDGAVLIGVSAGAVQLGLGTLLETSTMKKLSTFQFAPFYVGAHDESAEWWDLRALVNMAGEGVRGIGIPAGGGAVYSADGSLEPIRKPLVEFFKQEDRVIENLLVPSTDAGPAAEPPAVDPN
jgi:cyanophycinase